MEGGAESMMDSLPAMMYGAGDDEHPLPETVACMQHLVAEYVRHVTSQACMAAEVKGKLDTECFLFAVRHDKPKFKRVKYLLEDDVKVNNYTSMGFTDSSTATVFHPTVVRHPKVKKGVPARELSSTPGSNDGVP